MFKTSLLYTVYFSGNCFHGSCSHVHLSMTVLTMLKDAVHHTFSTWQRCFRSSSSSIPKAAYFFAMPLVMLCTPVCNLVCSIFQEHFYHHQEGGKEWLNEDLRTKRDFPSDFVVEENTEWHPQMERIFLIYSPANYHPPISITWASTATQTCKISQNNQFSCCERA